MDPKGHWETVYTSKSLSEVSWYQQEAVVSLELITLAAPSPESAIVDVGGGASTLVDSLIGRGHRNVTVLDIAAPAIEAARGRLGAKAGMASWIVANALTYPFAPSSVDVWHDRAVFHFLTSRKDRRDYVAQVARAVRPHGHVIVATFAADGPTRCSGLDVCRYDAPGLHREFGPSFDLLAQFREEHVTPSGAHQWFQYCLCSLRPAQLAAA
jgi:ubiquinone/menaquinone biosynthesis C-methylase UbiE